MNSQNFSLKPFPSTRPLPCIKIMGNIRRSSRAFSLSYLLIGPLAGLAVSPPADVPSRGNALWEDTCFEFFLGPGNAEHYWEFNLSPAGHWNVYQFESYRKGMREEPAFVSLPFSVQTHPEALQMTVDLDIGRIIPEGEVLLCGISAVIKSADGDVSHWALTHPGAQPDFHRRESFIVRL